MIRVMAAMSPARRDTWDTTRMCSEDQPARGDHNEDAKGLGLQWLTPHMAIRKYSCIRVFNILQCHSPSFHVSFAVNLFIGASPLMSLD